LICYPKFRLTSSTQSLQNVICYPGVCFSSAIFRFSRLVIMSSSAEMACRTVQVRVCSVCSKAAEPNRPPVRFVFVSNRTTTGPKKFCSRRTRTEQWSVRFEFVRDVRENVEDKPRMTFDLHITSKQQSEPSVFPTVPISSLSSLVVLPPHRRFRYLQLDSQTVIHVIP
jgi:hypothetical protein